jgi:signal transduction histidine kinase
MLLRKLGENYYGKYLVRVIEGITHNLSGPLQVLYIRFEQFEQLIEQMRGVPPSDGLTQASGLLDRVEGRITSISESLNDLNDQLRHLTSPLIVEKRSEISDVKMNKIMEDCLFLLNADMFFKHSVQKTVRLEDGLPTLRGRRTDFCIIVLNLVQNALESMVEAESKHLAVETSNEDDKVIIRIQDTGCGIPEQNMEHIYEPFFTTKKSTENHAAPDECAGLGLSLVSLLLEDCHGTIACESAPGKTIFTVQIPCITDPDE